MPLIVSVKKSNVPESVPGPKSFSGTSGKLERMSFQLLTFEPVFQIVFSSAVVRQSTQVFCRLTTMESPSFATVNATHLTPASRQRIASEFFIGREAFARSISLRQKRSKPPPVPEMPTVTRAPDSSAWKPSAAAIAYGPTRARAVRGDRAAERAHARRRGRGEHGGREDRQAVNRAIAFFISVSPLSIRFHAVAPSVDVTRPTWADRR